MLKTFIERPVLSTVISILIVILGIIGLNMLPIEQYPNIAPPTVRVSAAYSGANADVVMSSVVVPLEESINGVEGMTYMTSSASNSGSASINVFFNQNIDPDIAAVNVQNRVNQATSLLPAEVTQSGVTVAKRQNDNILRLSISSSNPDHDQQFIQNYTDINILPQIKRVQGVGEASVMGPKTYSMRIWLKPDAMATYKVTPTEIRAAINEQNVDAAPGSIGQNSNEAFEYSMKYSGRFTSADEFKAIIIRSQDGQILRLGDVADVELGSLNYSVFSTNNGDPSVMMDISQTSNSNARELIINIKKILDEASKSFPPGFSITYVSDVSEFLDASIEKVIHTLIEAFILVFLVVLIFLQNFRSTLIPAIAVPVAIIGTFFALEVMGFSINLLTLFALVLAIGIVVDDAIVVVEAVHAHLEQGAKNAKDATIKTMKEIAPAIVSITLVMASVFIPVSFIGGTSGVFYKQFGLTLAVAIFISAINALTLSPALSALFLQPHSENKTKKGKNLLERFYALFNKYFNKITLLYERTLHFLGKKKHRWITVTMIIVFSITLLILMKIIPSGFVPQEDSGRIFMMVTLPPGASLDRTGSVVKRTEAIARSFPEVAGTSTITGVNFMSGMGSPYGTVMVKLKPWTKRKRTADKIVGLMKQRTDSIIDATFMIFNAPTISGFGMASGVSLKMQDKTGGNIYDFYDVTQDFLSKLEARSEILSASTTFNPNFPQKQIDVNIARVKEAGLSLSDVLTTLQMNIGSLYASNITLFGKPYRVMIQATPEYRRRMEDLNRMYVRTGSGEMTPITEFLTIKDVTGPQTISRYNMYTSMDVTVIPRPGFSTGDVIRAIDEVKAQELPVGYTYEYTGFSLEEVKSGSQTMLIFMLCLIFVYLLLAALYESYILPLSVILSLPVGLAGVFIFLELFGVTQGITNNIYIQISLIMLIGLLAKNAILIVEYAIQRRQQGMNIVEAAIKGAVARFRPILMTSFAFIAGLTPLMLATGAGAVGNRSIGIGAIGGMLIGTVFGLLVIPSLYIIFQTMQDKFSKSGLINTNDEFINQSENDEKK
ncbi:MAG: efflux RND transporter permease subunit [Dysgonamonadaceae bacterium]|jgi:HAE1 family hydrophobic/amphiphilic exporter-1|nr:efflux RND transporter permease subunit [Dysgonamonadaceae bacterium]